jgi:thiol:disulfide interchange protein DsbC
MKTFLFVLCVLFYTSTSYAFQKDGCGSGNCLDCHSLNKEEAALLLKGKVDEVMNVKLSSRSLGSGNHLQRQTIVH